MWFKDAIGKAVGEVVGKMVANVQGAVAEELRGQVWREVRFGKYDHNALQHIREYGVELYRSGTQIRGEYGLKPLRTLYRYQGHLLCITTGETTTLNYTRGLDFDKLCKLADATAGRMPSVRKASIKDGIPDWDARWLAAKDLHKGKEFLALERDLLRWLTGESVFRRAGLPHRRGWLLYGKPGNGKTSAIQQLTAAHGLNIVIPYFHKGNLHGSDYMSGGSRPKRFLLIEDIDNIFRGREPLNPDADFGNFLNTIDGVNDLDNCIVVITTNDLSAIDPAIGRPRDETQWNSLSTRPGRIDRCIYFDNPDHEARLGIARKMLPEDEAARLAGEGDGLSVAQFSAVVRERAMEVVSEMVGEGVAGLGEGAGVVRGRG